MDTRRMCPNCRAFIKSNDRVCPYCDTKVGPRAIDRREPGQILGGFIPHAQFTTSIILLINLGLYAATVIFSMNNGNANALSDIDIRTLVFFGGKWNEGILVYHQWWRLVTAGFFHGSIMHILMNSWVLFDLGAQVEETFGSARLLAIYFLATLGGFFASFLWTPNVSCGASAGICGLLGAMIALGVRYRSPMGNAIRNLYLRWAVYLLLFGLVAPLFQLHVDNAAHIGGLIAGFVVAYLAGTPKAVENWTERIWRSAAVLCVFLTAFSFYEMYSWFDAVTKLYR